MPDRTDLPERLPQDLRRARLSRTDCRRMPVMRHASRWSMYLALLCVVCQARAQDAADPKAASEPVAVVAVVPAAPDAPAPAPAIDEDPQAALQRAAAERVRDAKNSTSADLNVLGVSLLEPINLPACTRIAPVPPDLMGIGRGGTETCKCDAPTCLPPRLKQAILATVSAARARLAWQPVLLSNAVCPAWMKSGGSCLVMFAVIDDVAAGALVPTGLDANTIEAQLAAKYQQPPMNGEEVQCKNRITHDVTSHTTERTWTPGGLSVSFHPVSRDCTHGRILIQTSLMRDAVTALDAPRSTPPVPVGMAN
jgi:hypothetical protein